MLKVTYVLLYKQFQVYNIKYYNTLILSYIQIIIYKIYKIVEDETSDNSCGVRQFAKISFNDKDLLGRLSGKKNTDIIERIVTGKSSSNKSDGTKYNFYVVYLKL